MGHSEDIVASLSSSSSSSTLNLHPHRLDFNHNNNNNKLSHRSSNNNNNNKQRQVDNSINDNHTIIQRQKDNNSSGSINKLNINHHQLRNNIRYSKVTMATFRGQATYCHQAKGKIINKLALVLLSIVILELVLIGDQVQPVKAIKKKIFLKKLKKMLPLLALIKPKKKIILLPIPIPMQMMKQSHFGGRPPMPGPPLIMPMNQMDGASMNGMNRPTNFGFDMGSSGGGASASMSNPNAPMMMGTLYPMGEGPTATTTTTTSSQQGSINPDSILSGIPPATMQVVAPPTTMTMTITAGADVGSGSSGSGGGMTAVVGAPPSAPPQVNSLPITSGNLLSYHAASASVPHNEPSGELYYSSPYNGGGNKNNNYHNNNHNNHNNNNVISQLQTKILNNHNSNNGRLRSPVHYGQQQYHGNNFYNNNNRQRQRDQPSTYEQQHQQQMTTHEIEMEFSPSAPLRQQHHHSNRQQQMIPFYPSDSESSQSAHSIVQLPVLPSNGNNYSGRLTDNQLYDQTSQQQLREIEPTKSIAPPSQAIKSGKGSSSGGY